MYKPTTEELAFMIRIMEEKQPELVRELSEDALEWLIAIVRLSSAVLHSEGKELIVP